MNEPKMSTGARISGGCMCGDVRFEATSEPLRITICHCHWCQKRTGTAFGVEAVFDREHLAVAGESLRSYRHVSDESGRWIEQSFCARCGSNIGLRLEAVPGIETVSAGAFDDPSLLQDDGYTVRHVFTRSARDWTLIPDSVEQHEEHFRK